MDNEQVKKLACSFFLIFHCDFRKRSKLEVSKWGKVQAMGELEGEKEGEK